MRAIYEPKTGSRAEEYSELGCTLRLTCSHACTYCFCHSVLRVPKEAFRNDV